MKIWHLDNWRKINSPYWKWDENNPLYDSIAKRVRGENVEGVKDAD